MSDSVNGATETKKNKYELVGGNKAPVNPFGADPENHAVKESLNETESDPFLKIEKEVSSFPVQVISKPEHSTPVNDNGARKAPKGFRLNPALVVAVVSLLVLGTCWMMGVFRGSSRLIDGSYRFDHIVANGSEVTPSQLSAYGVNTKDMSIKIDGDYADLTVFGFTGHCDFKQVGNDIKITNGSKYMTGRINSTNGTVILQHNGTDIVFTKE